MDIDEIFRQVLTQLSMIYSEHDRLAQNPSLYSDRFEWKLPNWVFTNKNRSWAIVLLISTKGFNITNEVNLRNKIIKHCDLHPDDEEWIKILTTVKIEPFSPRRVIEQMLKFMSPEDLFGNVIKTLARINLLLKPYDIDFDRDRLRSKVKHVKTSEYRDKGSRRPSHVSVKYKEISEKSQKNHQIDIPLRDQTCFWSNVKGLTNQSRTVRENTRLQEEIEERSREQIRNIRKRNRSELKMRIFRLKQLGVQKEVIDSYFDRISNLNSILNCQIYNTQLRVLSDDLTRNLVLLGEPPIVDQPVQALPEVI